VIAALDVHYDDASLKAVGAAVVFDHWDAAVAAAEYTTVVENVEPYVPGEFFRRELPCLLAVLAEVGESLDAVVVDGYVRLGAKPGLGKHLFERLWQTVAVIGVAKTRFHEAGAVEVFRGRSKSPLFVTAAGMEPGDAAERIRRMHGGHRIPTLLKRVDRLARESR
jgi:deoxyribonuclease V